MCVYIYIYICIYIYLYIYVYNKQHIYLLRWPVDGVEPFGQRVHCPLQPIRPNFDRFLMAKRRLWGKKRKGTVRERNTSIIQRYM